MSLANHVLADCPEGKTPALLLTTDPDANEELIETATEYVLIIRIEDFLRQSNPDAAAGYLARNVPLGITAIGRFADLANSPSRMAAFLERHLDPELISLWATNDANRLVALHRVLSGITPPELAAVAVAEYIRGLPALDLSVIEALIQIVADITDEEARLHLLKALTQDESGRTAMSQTLASRLEDRIEDVRRAAKGYGALLLTATSAETDFQNYFVRHPWLIGMDYVSVRPRFGIPRGQLDFILERYDGFHDVLELKDPQDPIITQKTRSTTGVPASSSQFSLSPDLANALAQVHDYRDILTGEESMISRRYGLQNSRNPRLMILIGKSSALTPERERILEQLNLSLHRVEIVPYDIVGRRAEAWLSNIEKHLALRD
jgi:hypothetical protein